MAKKSDTGGANAAAGENRPAGLIESALEPVVHLRQEMDRLFDEIWSAWPLAPGERRHRGGAVLPLRATMEPGDGRHHGWRVGASAADAVESETALVITVELPGIEEKDIDVRLSPDTLTIKGEKKDDRPDPGPGAEVYLRERRFGTVQRSFPVPEGIDSDRVEASFKNGVLTVVLPKDPTAAERARKINIKSRA